MQEQTNEVEGDQKLSKKQQNKLKKEAEKAEKKEQHKKTTNPQQQQQQDQIQQEDPLAANYGNLGLHQAKTNRKWTKVENIDETLKGQIILVRARIHNSRVKGNLAFIVLRETYYSVQVVAAKGDFVSKQMLKFIDGISTESIVDITAEVIIPKEAVKSCTQKVELDLKTIHVVSRSEPQLPFQIDDASRKLINEHDVQEVQAEKDEKLQISVMLNTRLNDRVIDLRTPAKQAIFRVQSGVSQLFREFLFQNQFIEIHTPKLIGGASEGGTNVFKLKYFNQDACLAQSPQLYKQMCLMGDFDRVFEIGPVFRAENSNTHRHLCEFNSLDLEMVIKEDFMELLDLMGELVIYMFKGLEQRYAKEIKVIGEQFTFQPFKYTSPALKLTFQEGVKMLQEAGVNQDPLEDLDTVNEKKLGALVRAKYDTDFYMLYNYPKNARPFYTMPNPVDPNYTLSYDFFMRGEEILSGAQRIHDPALLEKNILEKGINLDTLKDYVNSFKYGAFPHGGCAFGLERIVFLYFNLHDIRNATLFPRDPQRLAP